MSNMKKVKVYEGKPFIGYIIKNGRCKGNIHRNYGEIRKCEICANDFFAYNTNIKKGAGRFCSKKCAYIYHIGENNPKWRGGKTRTAEGYVNIYSPTHPNRNKMKYMREHRLVMEKHLGRHLNAEERVHHINSIKDDNRIENLVLFGSEKEHQLNGIHENKLNGRWSVKHKECVKCGTNSRKYCALGYCTRCYQQVRKPKKI